MQKLKKNASLLLMICLSGCGDLVFERCVPSLKDNAVFCHDYEVSEDFIGKVSETVERPISYIDGAKCVTPDDWDRIYGILKSEIENR